MVVPTNGGPEALGWVKLYRSILRHRLWALPATHIKVALTVLLSVNRRSVRVWNGRDEIPLDAGELLTSQDALAVEAGGEITRRIVRRALTNLEKVGFLSVRRSAVTRPNPGENAPRWSGRGIVVSISNWERYQANGDEGGPASVHTRSRRGPNGGTFAGHRQEVEKKRRREVEDSGSAEASAPVPADVLSLFVSTFDRHPTPAERGILASLSSKPLEALAAALHETRERGLDLTYAQAVLRFAGSPATNGDYQAGRLGTGGRA